MADSWLWLSQSCNTLITADMLIGLSECSTNYTVLALSACVYWLLISCQLALALQLTADG